MAVVATGSVAYDHILSFRGRFADHVLADKAHALNLSFLVDSVVRRRGGVAANYAYTLSLLGYPAAVLATVGDDAREFERWLASRGIDTSGLIILDGEQTATGYITTDLDDNQITGYFGGAMLRAASIGLESTGVDPEVVIVGPNAPDAMMRLVAECRARRIPWVWDPAHQLPRLTTEQLIDGCRGAWMLIGNDYEIELITERTRRTFDGLLELSELVVTTHGRLGSVIRSRTECRRVDAAPVVREADPVGAGDAYRGGLVYGLLTGSDLLEAGRIASVAAAYVVEQHGTLEHSYTRAEFAERFRAAYGVDLARPLPRDTAVARDVRARALAK